MPHNDNGKNSRDNRSPDYKKRGEGHERIWGKKSRINVKVKDYVQRRNKD